MKNRYLAKWIPTALFAVSLVGCVDDPEAQMFGDPDADADTDTDSDSDISSDPTDPTNPTDPSDPSDADTDTDTDTDSDTDADTDTDTDTDADTDADTYTDTDTGYSDVVGPDMARFNPGLVTTTCPSIPNSGTVNITPGQDVGGIVSSNGDGTSFVFASGTYSGVSISPKNGQKFYGQPGTKLDGNGAGSAFRSGASDVYICGFEITGYMPYKQDGAIHAQGSAPGERWLVENVNVHDNAGAGVMFASNSTFRNSRVSRNWVTGLKASGADNAAFINVEFAENGWNNVDGWGWEGGGSKFSQTRGLRISSCWSHHNIGPGIWNDWRNWDVLFEYNLVTDNTAPGIMHELSQTMIVRNNVITGNGHLDDCGGWTFRCGGIYISSSYGSLYGEGDGKQIEVYDNYLEGNRNGIVLTTDDRETVGEVDAHDNLLVNSGTSGIDQGGSYNAPLWNTIHFNYNTYQGTSGWNLNGGKSWNEWQAAGHDLNGSYQP